MRLLVEHVDKSFADDFTLAFRIGNALQFGEEFCRSVDANDVESEAFVVAHHVLELVFAEQPMVDKDASQVAPDSLVE